MPTASPIAIAPSAGRSAVAVELAFLGHALERLACTLDAVLVIIAVGRQQLDDRIGFVGAGAPHRSRGKIDGLSDRELVSLQRYSPARNQSPRAGGIPA